MQYLMSQRHEFCDVYSPVFSLRPRGCVLRGFFYEAGTALIRLWGHAQKRCYGKSGGLAGSPGVTALSA